MTSNRWAIVMAGGSGTRFWPLSRERLPKQLLSLTGTGETLIAATLRRIAPLVPPERTLIVTSESLATPTGAALAAFPAARVLAEPVGRNTAPCVGWAASIVRRIDPDAVLAVLPADHFIRDEDAFRATCERAFGAAGAGHLVTIGLRPTRPETGYGYIEVGEPIADGVEHVRRFVEKPDRARAEDFLARGGFLWNSGAFFFSARAVLDAIAAHLPELAAGLAAFDRASKEGTEREAVRAGYAALPAISIDHGVLERATNVAVVAGDFGWSDVGSFTTAWELAAHDASGNALDADAIVHEARNNYVHAPPGKLVALLGVDDLVVVDTPDALLVMPRERAQEVRKVVDSLKARGDRRR